MFYKNMIYNFLIYKIILKIFSYYLIVQLFFLPTL